MRAAPNKGPTTRSDFNENTTSRTTSTSLDPALVVQRDAFRKWGIEEKDHSVE